MCKRESACEPVKCEVSWGVEDVFRAKKSKSFCRRNLRAECTNSKEKGYACSLVQLNGR